MEKYTVIYNKGFKDLEDNNHLYRKGDIYPREGLEPTKKRIKELTSEKNKIGKILIQKIEVEEETNESEDVKTEENTKIEESETTDKNEEE